MPNFKFRDRTYINIKEKPNRISGSQEKLDQIASDFCLFGLLNFNQKYYAATLLLN